MSAQSLSLPGASWIIDRRNDLIFFCGSAVFGYMLLLTAWGLRGLPGRLLVGLAFAIDGPHVYSTMTRSLFDSSERRRLKLLWLIGLPICCSIGPILNYTIGWQSFFLIVAGFSHYHISKQHMGFVMIYKRKAGEREDFKADKYFSLASLILPFLFYLSAVFSGSTTMFPFFIVPAATLAGWYGAHQLGKKNKNVPKLLLLAGFIPLQWLGWSYAALAPDSLPRLVTVGAILNIGHSMQYLRLMWFHNHNRYDRHGGLLGVVSRKWIYFLTFAVFLAAIPSMLSHYMKWWILTSGIVGFLFFHFLVDAKIWRVRGDVELARALRL